ncbi:alpha/beta hydrolase family protein [Actinocorallia herbida]|uniref:Alpha/beta hydrolase family protein n=1 Tax=Actinocorallia herbida TaxID=58109 RepID=A0A3N1D705_9ACTN|nr:alpha/beta fold hydrolase [Actinocorallia herbida]ROO89304.1 alpha/beta hydrolase family protein [Actinocorallia herbida]
MTDRIPRFTLQGVTGTEMSERLFATEDGLGLSLTRFHRADCDDVVLLIHGLTLSRDMFIMPEHTNLVSYLLDAGFTDVWTLDYRMSNRFPYDLETHRHTLDDVAAFDHPAALEALREVVGDRRIHVIAHCLGSVTFMASLFGGKVDQITSVVANSVSLHPRVSKWAALKLRFGPALAEYGLGMPVLDPRFGDALWFTRRKVFSRAVSLFHRECRDSACHMLSFMWGDGKPAMFAHEMLHEATHERMEDLCGACGVHYYRHVAKMVAAGHIVPFDEADTRLPDVMGDLGAVETPILLLAGTANHVFTDSNIVTHAALEQAAPGRHELELLPGYGHVDPFVGKKAHEDVFPRIVEFLRKKAV